MPGDSGLVIPMHGSPGVPNTIWRPPQNADHSPALCGSVLPAWALDRACARFAPHGGAAAVLLPPGPGDTERTARPTGAAPGWLGAAQPVDLADAGRARIALALLLADPILGSGPQSGALPGFFAEIRAALQPGALLLIHTHPIHTTVGPLDPAGRLLRAGRAAGLRPVQRITILHQQPAAAPCAHRRCTAPAPVYRPMRSDLYALSPDGAR